MSKIKVKVCRICLRSDVGAKDVDATINDFYDELCEYDVSLSSLWLTACIPIMAYCTITTTIYRQPVSSTIQF